MKFKSRKTILAFTLLLSLLLVNCIYKESIEVQTVSPTSYATSYYETPTSTPSLDTEISSLLTRYGWTIKQQISIHTETLPKNLQHYPGDFPYVIYWAYNNEFNKDIGFDLVPYLGQTVQASIYSLNEPLPEEFYPYTEAYATVVISDNKIIGAWIDRGRHYGFACSLDRKNFDEIVNQEWSEWLISSGVVDLDNELDRELSKKTPEEIIEIYYTAMNERDYQLFYAVQSRWNIAVDLFRNKDELALFNHQDDPANRRWMDNIESAHLVNIEEAGFSTDCFPVYAASVNFQFVDPLLPTIPEGESLRFVVLNEEIEGLGWRIEEVNTSPGGSNRLCAPSPTSLLIPEIPLTVFFPANYTLTKNDELHLRGSYLSYGFDRIDEPSQSISPPYPSAPYFAEIYFFSEDSITHYVDYCATTETDGGESFCNLGNHPDIKTYYGQRESFLKLSDYENYKLEKIGDRYYFTSPYFGRRGSYTKTKEYTTFVGDIKIDIWISLASYMDYQPEEVLQLRSVESDQLFRLFYIDTN